MSGSGLGIGMAEAATRTTTLMVSVTITAGCTTSATNLAFASQGMLTPDLDRAHAFTVSCTNTAPHSVGWNSGRNVLGSTADTNATGHDDHTVTATVTY
jgi:spore coat protein U-like protein